MLAFLSKYHDSTLLSSLSFVRERLCIERVFFPMYRDKSCVASSDFASSGVFLFSRIKQACCSVCRRAARQDRYILNQFCNGREKRIARQEIANKVKCSSPPGSCCAFDANLTTRDVNCHTTTQCSVINPRAVVSFLWLHMHRWVCTLNNYIRRVLFFVLIWNYIYMLSLQPLCDPSTLQHDTEVRIRRFENRDFFLSRS